MRKSTFFASNKIKYSFIRRQLEMSSPESRRREDCVLNCEDNYTCWRPFVFLSSFLCMSSLPRPPRLYLSLPWPPRLYLSKISHLPLFRMYPLCFDDDCVDILLSFFLTNSYAKQLFLCDFTDNCVSFKILFVFLLLIAES